MTELLSGVFAASLTPVTTDLEIDHALLVKHCRWLLDNGCHGIGLLGTTGEANSFNVAQRQAALEAMLTGSIPANKLLVGTGCTALADTINLTRHAMQCGVNNVLLLPPFYYKKVTDDGLYTGIARLIDATNSAELRIYLYHFLQLSAIPFSLRLIERLVTDFPAIVVGIKDSGGDFVNMRLVQQRFPEFRVFAGTERYLTDILAVGGAGCISATANLTSPKIRAIYDSPAENRPVLQEKLNKLRDVFEQYPMIPALKQVMYDRGGDKTWLNMVPPHVPLQSEVVKQLLADYKSQLNIK